MGWPVDWEATLAGVGCVACREGRPEAIEPGERIYAGSCSDAYLYRRSIVPGYSVVFFRGRHVVDPIELSEEEASRYALEVRHVARAVERAYRPTKLNYLVLGNVMPHLHTHIVPRYEDDPDAGRPPRFMMEDVISPAIPVQEYTAQLERLRRETARADDAVFQEQQIRGIGADDER